MDDLQRQLDEVRLEVAKRKWEREHLEARAETLGDQLEERFGPETRMKLENLFHQQADLEQRLAGLQGQQFE